MKKWAVVTGSTSGIGSALALRAAEQGLSVVLHGRDRSRLSMMKKEVEAKGVKAATICCNLDSVKSAERVYWYASHVAHIHGGTLYTLVANAGIARTGKFGKMPRAEINEMLTVNIISTVALCRIFAADEISIKEKRRLLITSSIAGSVDHGVATAAVYAGTKSFLRSFGNALRSEGHQVCVLLPGATASRFAKNSGMKNTLVFTLAPRVAVSSPFDVAAAVDFRVNGKWRRELIPGFLNRLFVLSCDLGPNMLGRAVANLAFSQKKKKDTNRKLNCRGGFQALPILPTLFTLLLTLTASNIAQNYIAPQEFLPRYKKKKQIHDLLAFPTKKACIEVWRKAPPPQIDSLFTESSCTLRGQLLFRGICAPMTSFITNTLFPLPLLKTTWTGKRLFYDQDRTLIGLNLFSSNTQKNMQYELRPFWAAIAPSKLDGQDALVLQYTGLVWGKLIGMRDEIREISPGVLIGLGSMRATGGPINCAPFLLLVD